MTNGEKIKAMFPSMEVGFITESQIGIYFVKNQYYAIVFDLDWWNAEYKESTKSCSTCRSYKGHAGHCDICHNMSMYKKVEPTTKNDLGVENDLVSSIVEKISEKVTETREEFIFETIRPYCENVVQMKISKRDLEQALLKYYGKNDLAVDTVSRKAVHDMLENLPVTVEDKWFNWLQKACMRLAELPSVTPQEPRKGYWIPTYGNVKCSVCGSVKDSREVGKATHYCDFCGAKMVEPQESEAEDGECK